MPCKGCAEFYRRIKAVARMPRSTHEQRYARMRAANRIIDQVWKQYPSTCIACQIRRLGP